VIDGFRRLITERAGVVILQSMPLAPSSSPASVVEDEPNEKFALCRGSRFAKQLGPLHRMLTDEEIQVSRRSGKDPVRSPPPVNLVRLILKELGLSDAVPNLEVFQQNLHGERP